MAAHGARGRAAAAMAVVALSAATLSGCAADDATPVAATTAPPAATLSPTGTATATAVPVDPCSLVTTAQVQKALGGSVADRQLNLADPAIPTCTWAVSRSRLGTGTLRLAVTGTGGTATTFQALRSAYPSALPIQGVGDAAFAVSSIGQVVVFQRGTTLTVAASGFTKDGADPDRATTTSALTAVATTAAASL